MTSGLIEDDDRPASGDVYAMWRELDMAAVVVDAPAVDDYLLAFQEECGARTARGCVEWGSAPMIDDYFDRLDWLEFGTMLLTSGTAVDEAVPEVFGDAGSPTSMWDEVSRFSAGGVLAGYLYDSAGQPADDAARYMALGTSVITEIIGDRYGDLAVWASEDSGFWCPWMQDSRWNAIWLIADRVARRVHILCIALPDE